MSRPLTERRKSQRIQNLVLSPDQVVRQAEQAKASQDIDNLDADLGFSQGEEAEDESDDNEYSQDEEPTRKEKKSTPPKDATDEEMQAKKKRVWAEHNEFLVDPEIGIVDAEAADRLVFMDVEFHQKAGGRICQICLVSLGGTIALNHYVFHRPLHPDWMQLVRDKKTILDPWDDETIAETLDVVFLAMLEQLPDEAILLFKGTADIRTIVSHLESLRDKSEKVDTIEQRLEEKKIRSLSIDGVWRWLRDLMPPSIQSALTSGDKKAIPELSAVYDSLFWKPILVHVPPLGDASTEKVARTNLEKKSFLKDMVAKIDMRTFQTEFLRRDHHQPAFHTAHTDTLVMRNITVYLLYYAQYRYELWTNVMRADVLDFPETIAVMWFATFVVRRTRWFREDRHLMASPEGIRQLYAHCAKQAKEIQLGLLPLASEEEEEGVPLPGRKSYFSSGTMQKARKKRLAQASVAVHHRDSDTLDKVYAPILGRDAFKLRALKDLVGIKLDGASTNVFDRLEDARRKARPGAPPVGTRPWFYSATATGKQAPHTQVLHSRKCTDRMNGNDYSSGPEYESDTFQLHEFDFMAGPPVGIRTVFCKMCKEYEEGVYPDLGRPEVEILPVATPGLYPDLNRKEVVVDEDPTMHVLQMLAMHLFLRKSQHG